ncbi:Uncharacterized protein ACO02O_10312 [Dirofilaria immitis]
MNSSSQANLEKNEMNMNADATINYFINNCFYQSLNHSEISEQQTNLARYLDELIVDLQELNKIEMEYPGLLLHVHALLTAELNRVWNLLCNKQINNPINSSENESQSQPLDETSVTLQEKIVLSREQTANYVQTANSLYSAPLKCLENETNCQILIRGKGSLMDHRRESRLKNYAGWEHLTEPLHLLVRANDATITRCTMKLANGVRRVKQYLRKKQSINDNQRNE